MKPRQPGLFDEPAMSVSLPPQQNGFIEEALRRFSARTPTTGSHLPPHAIFISWPLTQQLRYCAARDRESATLELDPQWQVFYQARAARYEQDACA